MAKHERPARSDEWYTPEFVFSALGVRFDLDVAAPPQSVPCAADGWCDTCITAGSLEKPWFGFVWMNPPFGKRNGLAPWLDKFFAHGCGIALTPDRTSAPWWQKAADRSDAVLFWAPKIHFEPGPGAQESSPAQGTTLMAKGAAGVLALEQAALSGHGVILRKAI